MALQTALPELTPQEAVAQAKEILASGKAYGLFNRYIQDKALVKA